MKSDLFSLCASSFASLSEALSERLKTENPLAFLFVEASAWIEINRSAFNFSAKFILSLK